MQKRHHLKPAFNMAEALKSKKYSIWGQKTNITANSETWSA